MNKQCCCSNDIQDKIFKILSDFEERLNLFEKKIEEINKCRKKEECVKKNKKINLIDWLNLNLKPSISFDEIIDTIIVEEKDILNLFDNSFNDVLNEIFSRNIYNLNEDNSIVAFIQNTNIFYIYQDSWIEMNKETFIKFLNKVHFKVMKEYYIWKHKNIEEIKANDNFAIRCNKVSIKITKIEFTNDLTLNTIKSQMFTKIKRAIFEDI